VAVHQQTNGFGYLAQRQGFVDDRGRLAAMSFSPEFEVLLWLLSPASAAAGLQRLNDNPDAQA
jgi:hypothetical protein